MAYESVNDPRDLAEERFSWLEAQVVDISHNMNFLMLTQRHKLNIFGEDGECRGQIKGEIKRSGRNKEPIEESTQKKFNRV